MVYGSSLIEVLGRAGWRRALGMADNTSRASHVRKQYISYGSVQVLGAREARVPYDYNNRRPSSIYCVPIDRGEGCEGWEGA